jgi:hypothetical protein
MFANSQVAQADAPATSKKWTQTRRRLDSLRKSMIPLVAWLPFMRNFPSIQVINSCKIRNE